MKLREKNFQFQDNDWMYAVKYVEINIESVTREPTLGKLKEWLEMLNEEEKLVEQLRSSIFLPRLSNFKE